MFNKDKTKINQAKKDILEKELELWVKEEKFKAREAVESFRNERDKELQTLALASARDTKNYEHTYHQAMQDLGIEIAKLESKRDALKEIAGQDKITYNTIISSKDDEIARLTSIISTLIGKEGQPITINNNK